MEEVFVPVLARVMFELTDDGLVCPRVFSVFKSSGPSNIYVAVFANKSLIFVN